ncbi:P-type conjugative transfer protein TrbL [Sporomusa sphaeroides]|uniref:P-type conjugative transfer protein TrbL n=1 Tax=Sporomusa sphaeroides TaxID=47679 RepID=UPI0031590569
MTDFADKNALTDLMNLFIDKCIAGADLIIFPALGLLGTLACIELALVFLFNAMDGSEDPIYLLVKKLIKYSFFVWLIQNWATGMRFSKQILEWFSYIGAQAAGSQYALLNPAAIGEQGIRIAVSLIQPAINLSLGSIGVMFLKIILAFTIFLIFTIIAVYVFRTTMEFYVLGTLTTALLPFGACRYTAFLSEKAIGAICSVSIKMMFLQFALCIAAPFLDSVQPFTAQDTDFAKGLQVIVACIGMAIFCIGMPQLASSYLAGSPSFGDGTAGAVGAVAGSAAGKAASTVAGAPGAAMRAAGMVQAAANAPGGRAAGGKMDMAGVANNLGRMARQNMPDRQAQMHGKSLFNASRSLERDQIANQAKKNQTNLF